ncbi:MAG: ComF family protein [Bacteroidaceae bacterium]|nr:ComF family protein [Bacteroidaceae bacterium]
MNPLNKFVKKLLTDIRLVFFPIHCMVCGRRLSPNEKHICVACLMDFPHTYYDASPGNPIERLFWGKIPIIKANALFFYHSQNAYTNLITQLKYNQRTDLGLYLGRLMAKQVSNTDFFKNIDYIIPVPLAKQRVRKRGYNQCEYIAKGIQDITAIPIHTKAIQRCKNNPTQTHLTREERILNVADIFKLSQPLDVHKHHELENKHVLLIDDVLTTGSTIMACASVLATIPNIKISIYTAAVAGRHGAGVDFDKEVFDVDL